MHHSTLFESDRQVALFMNEKHFLFKVESQVDQLNLWVDEFDCQCIAPTSTAMTTSSIDEPDYEPEFKPLTKSIPLLRSCGNSSESYVWK